MAINDQASSGMQSRFPRLWNWVSLTGVVTVAASVFAAGLLFLIDTFGKATNPYVGILTYLVAPMFTVLGVALIVIGMMLRRREVQLRGAPIPLVIDLSRSRDRRILGYFIGASALFLVVTAIGSYHSYHFTESTAFCGQACHTVMEPEMVTYQHSAHARVACVQCHIGPGAKWFVKAKLSGLHQVYAVAANTYPRPVPTPIANLRPAQDTCEQCHWPEKFSGDMVRKYTHFLSDATNSEYSITMMLRVGGGAAHQGPVEGIHWHTSKDHRVEYIATDPLRLKIPWVRLTDKDGQTTEFRSPDFTNEVKAADIRVMDCIDCHNRPAHRYEKPNEAVDEAIALGRIDRSLTSVRSNATQIVTATYTNRTEALAQIASRVEASYPGEPRAKGMVEALQDIYQRNFFPAMNANWRAYPEHIGHKDWPGCVRCHDDKHTSADGQKVIGFKDCQQCHAIVAQGSGAELSQFSPAGQEFKHPGEEWDPSFACHDCHTGGP